MNYCITKLADHYRVGNSQGRHIEGVFATVLVLSGNYCRDEEVKHS